jgi:hypothetical protein
VTNAGRSLRVYSSAIFGPIVEVPTAAVPFRRLASRGEHAERARIVRTPSSRSVGAATNADRSATRVTGSPVHQFPSRGCVAARGRRDVGMASRRTAATGSVRPFVASVGAARERVAARVLLSLRFPTATQRGVREWSAVLGHPMSAQRTRVESPPMHRVHGAIARSLFRRQRSSTTRVSRLRRARRRRALFSRMGVLGPDLGAARSWIRRCATRSSRPRTGRCAPLSSRETPPSPTVALLASLRRGVSPDSRSSQ